MSVRQSFLKGVKWSLLQQVFTQIINYVSIFWLAVLVTPEDFGKVVLVVVFVGIFEAVNGFGVSQLIIKNNITDARIINSYFWFVVLLSLALTAFSFVASVAYASFFDLNNPWEFKTLIMVSVSSLVVNGINSVYNALFSRDMDFKTPSKYFVSSLLIGNVVAVAAGYLGLGYWALIIKNLLPIILLATCFIVVSRYRIGLSFEKRFIRDTWNFSSHFTYFNALNYLVRNLDYIIIGKFFDLAIVGQYSIAYKIMIFPMKNITARVQAVLFPLLTKISQNTKKVERYYVLVVSGIGYLTFPLAVIISSLSFLWVPLFFDIEKYDKLVVLVQLLSIVGAVQAITSPVMSLYLLTGKTKILFYMGLIIAFINTVGFLIGGLSGNIYRFALIYAVIQLFVSIPLSNYVPFRLMNFHFIGFLKTLFIPFIASVGAYLVVTTFEPVIETTIYLKIFILGTVTVVSYLLFLLLISRAQIIEQLKQIRLIVSKK